MNIIEDSILTKKIESPDSREMPIYDSITGKRWQEKAYDLAKSINYSNVLGTEKLLSQILVNRTSNTEEAAHFLDPKLKNCLPDPFIIKDMEKACDRIVKALNDNEKIVIFGDYDVDGAVSSALLKNFFKSLDKEVDVYIPNRFTDGYGPSIGVFSKLNKAGYKLIITVDCGSMAHAAIEYANEQGMEVIITDHHQVDQLPKAFALVNPNRSDDTSGLKYLAGCGVAFMLIVGICKKFKEQDEDFVPPNLLHHLDLVALGTVCDVVPLTGLNRAFVRQGLRIMQESKNPGINKMLSKLQKDNTIDTFTLGFILGPRINAGGRVGESSLGVQLLTSKNESEVEDIFEKLNSLNEERKKIELGIFEEAMLMAESQTGGVILVASNGWHQGIIGIVASRLKEKHNKPAVVIALENGKGKGSCRAVGGFDIGATIIEAAKIGLIESGGGHRAAAGLVLKEAQIANFHQWLNEIYEKNKHIIAEKNIIFFDASLIPELINEDFYQSLCALKPFGVANESPRFLIKNAKIAGVKVFAGQNLMFNILGQNGKNIRAKAFRASDSGIGEYLINNLYKAHNFIVSLKKNDFYSNNKIEVTVEDVIISSN